MAQTNMDIRKLAKEKSVYLWEIAQRLGYTDATFSRKLRKELSPKEKQFIRGIIKGIADTRRE